ITRSESYTLPSSDTTSEAPQPFSVMKIDFAPQSDCTWCGPQYKASGSKRCQDDCIFGRDALIGISRYPGASPVANTYPLGLYTLIPTKSTGDAIVFSSSSVNFGSSFPVLFR